MPTISSADQFDSSATGQSSRPEDIPRTWWFSEDKPDGTKQYNKLDVALRFLREVLEQQGPFDAVWGFSQGAALAGMLVALVETPSKNPIFAAPGSNWPPKPFKFGILSCGFEPVDPEVRAWFNPPPKTPTLHVLGRGDTIVGEDRSVPFIGCFEGARAEWHDGGHHAPSKASWRQFFKAYIKEFKSDTPDVAAVPSPSAPAEPDGGKL
ncbi:hypothetical protein MNV49_003085 [Pseudohyphozyma bogoriensis]|nr:hypothetical protein MNV49_003085 [Pseudohyphozyma bogoriensis]